MTTPARRSPVTWILAGTGLVLLGVSVIVPARWAALAEYYGPREPEWIWIWQLWEPGHGKLTSGTYPMLVWSRLVVHWVAVLACGGLLALAAHRRGRRTPPGAA